ncbi:N-acyl-phosphatidylethanolamine-hydrolyzing phospholipase D [Vararia minispora EC-137]|uniref:N-acyl-phosphatidylethanolamine-hydrolyzing phospholipase D n=1 Tax=Vararia minispora EC-137 TaxID=1314806 RepID=A0ACB8QUE7_9AGAM|nr:N-acyl-phosphatidylethanolamine-hydrolyzing phospholipase D [Vararia minispora EC-137]
MAAPIINVVEPPRKFPSLSINGARPAHHLNDTKSKFYPPWPSFRYQDRSQWFTVWRPTFMFHGSASIPPDVKKRIPSQVPTWGSALENKSQAKATWLGHACYLLELPIPPGASRGMRIIFDPVLSYRCSPSQRIGPARYTDAPCKAEEIPAVDAIVLSHDHYDHTDVPTLRALLANPASAAHVFVSLNNKDLFLNEVKLPAERVHEFEWWDQRIITVSLGKDQSVRARITSTPSQHTSGRTGWDRWHALWSAWVIEELPDINSDTTVGKRLYFAGDTGYRTVRKGDDEDKVPVCPAFAEVGERFGGVDVALIPIGAYAPRTMWSNLHADPADAVRIMKDVKAKRALAMHWGTWSLTAEPVLEPPQVLMMECKAAGIGEDEFLVPALGETILF